MPVESDRRQIRQSDSVAALGGVAHHYIYVTDHGGDGRDHPLVDFGVTQVAGHLDNGCTTHETCAELLSGTPVDRQRLASLEGYPVIPNKALPSIDAANRTSRGSSRGA